MRAAALWRGALLACALSSGALPLAAAPQASAPSVAAHGPRRLTDDRGVTVLLPAPARRVVSLLPSLTETVCALGACERLVGVDTYSNWPPSVAKLPHVGGLEDAQVEAIVALRPDLVLTATSTRAIARLESLGLRVAALEPRSLEDVRRVTGQLALALGSDAAPALWRQTEQGLAAAARELPAPLRGARVYVEVGSGPYAASESSFIGELLARLGAVNVVPGALGPFPLINPEFVVRADPQIIILPQRDAAGLAARPGWRAIRAVRDERVCPLSPQQSDMLMRAGPRLVEAARLLAACLQRQGRS